VNAIIYGKNNPEKKPDPTVCRFVFQMIKDLLHKSNKTGNCLFYFYTDNSIQISEATHDLLQSIGGFRT
jgi:hypothetical protein